MPGHSGSQKKMTWQGDHWSLLFISLEHCVSSQKVTIQPQWLRGGQRGNETTATESLEMWKKKMETKLKEANRE